MATSKKPLAPSGAVPVHILDWLRAQTALPVEAAAAFWRHVGHDAWDTAEHWATRWEAWFHGPVHKQ